ncbi:MAG: GNAT family N-acetyltransferase [candidate division WOR-3 bacterium]
MLRRNKNLRIEWKPIPEIEEEWNGIFKLTEEKAPFLSFGWFYSLSKYLLKKDFNVMVLYDESEIVGIIPGEIKNRKLSLIGDERVTDLNGILFNPKYSEDVINTLSSFIKEKELRFELYPILPESPLMKIFPNESKKELVNIIPILKLPRSWEEYLENLPSKERHEVRRKLRKVEGLKIRSLKGEEIKELFIMMESFPQKREFLTKNMKKFFLNLALYLEGEKLLRLKASFYKREILAILFCFQSENTIYAFNSAYNTKFYKLSPGFVSFAMDIKEAIEEGFTYYNFLRGEERFKFDLGARKTYTWKIKR